MQDDVQYLMVWAPEVPTTSICETRNCLHSWVGYFPNSEHQRYAGMQTQTDNIHNTSAYTTPHCTDLRRCSTPTSSASSAPISLGTCSNVLDVGVPSCRNHMIHQPHPLANAALTSCTSSTA